MVFTITGTWATRSVTLEGKVLPLSFAKEVMEEMDAEWGGDFREFGHVDRYSWGEESDATYMLALTLNLFMRTQGYIADYLYERLSALPQEDFVLVCEAGALEKDVDVAHQNFIADLPNLFPNEGWGMSNGAAPDEEDLERELQMRREEAERTRWLNEFWKGVNRRWETIV